MHMLFLQLECAPFSFYVNPTPAFLAPSQISLLVKFSSIPKHLFILLGAFGSVFSSSIVFTNLCYNCGFICGFPPLHRELMSFLALQPHIWLSDALPPPCVPQHLATQSVPRITDSHPLPTCLISFLPPHINE
jgi:hypothetical protein